MPRKKERAIKCPKCSSKDISISRSRKYGDSTSKKRCKECKHEWK
jgi:transcriptional regulator NrdR family protein